MTNKCNECFYALMDRDSEAPCVTCTGYSNFVSGYVYMTKDNNESKPLREAIDSWYSDKGTEQYDTIAKPKHYMLFEEQGIEVRDVLAKLADKIKMSDQRVPLWEVAPLFEADYVQMMQYLMRFMDKNGREDLKKARWYLDKLIEAYDDESDF